MLPHNPPASSWGDQKLVVKLDIKRSLLNHSLEAALSSGPFDLIGPTSDGYLIIIKWQALDRHQRVVILQFASFTEAGRLAGR